MGAAFSVDRFTRHRIHTANKCAHEQNRKKGERVTHNMYATKFENTKHPFLVDPDRRFVTINFMETTTVSSCAKYINSCTEFRFIFLRVALYFAGAVTSVWKYLFGTLFLVCFPIRDRHRDMTGITNAAMNSAAKKMTFLIGFTDIKHLYLTAIQTNN